MVEFDLKLSNSLVPCSIQPSKVMRERERDIMPRVVYLFNSQFLHVCHARQWRECHGGPIQVRYPPENQNM